MKYKVGDKVKVREDLDSRKVYGVTQDMEKLKGKIVTISECGLNYRGESNYRIKEFDYYWTDEMFEGLAEYTYEDLKKAPLGTKVTFEKENKVVIKAGMNDFENEKAIIMINNLIELKDNLGDWGKIIKIEEPQYTTVYEAKKDILDEKEREYLSNVIKPFKDKVTYMKKRRCVFNTKEYIYANLSYDDGDETYLEFPNFKKDTMYKGMEADREYSLKDLGLN